MVDKVTYIGDGRFIAPVSSPQRRRPIAVEFFQRTAAGSTYAVGYSEGPDELMTEDEARLLAEANRIPWRDR